MQEAIEYCQTDPPEITADSAAETAPMDAAGMNDPNYKFHPHPKALSPQELDRINRQHA